MKRVVSLPKIVSLVLSLFLIASAHAAPIFFDNGLTNQVNTDVSPDFLLIENNGDGDATTVELLDGAFIGTDRVIVDDTSIAVFDTSILRILGGEAENDVETYNRAQLDMFSGVVLDDLQSFNRSTLNIYGGRVGDDLEAEDRSTVNIWGGVFDEDIEAFDSAQIFIFGGLFGADGLGRLDSGFSANDEAEIILFGSDFRIDGQAFLGGAVLGLSGMLEGVLDDGSSFFMPFEQEFAGLITLVDTSNVSEPGVLALCALLLGIGLMRRRRQA